MKREKQGAEDASYPHYLNRLRDYYVLITELVSVFSCGQEGVACLSWLGSSKYVATGCVDGKVRVWDSLSGDCVRIYSGHSDAIQSLAVSANGEFLVSVSIDGTARVFEIAEFQ